MKVLLINGSPHQRGCTYTALAEVAKSLEENGVGAEIAWIGAGAVHGCIACGKCGELGRCVFDGDACNEIRAKALEMCIRDRRKWSVMTIPAYPFS